LDIEVVKGGEDCDYSGYKENPPPYHNLGNAVETKNLPPCSLADLAEQINSHPVYPNNFNARENYALSH